jgi:hypothetical protein
VSDAAGAGLSRTSMTVAAGRISTEGGTRERVLPGWVPPPGTGASVATLTHSVSQTVHEPAAAAVPRQIPRRYIALGLIVVAICLLGALVFVRDHAAPSTSSTIETFNAAPSSLVSGIASVPTAVYDAVGVNSPTIPLTAPQATGSTRSWTTSANGISKPVVFFYGAEFAPYPAAERWPLVLALSRFGTFKQLGLMQSSQTTAFANLSTFTFWQANYSSKYLALQHVERYSALNPTGASYLKLEQPNSRQASAVSNYSSSPTNFALLDVGNRWVLNGSSYAPSVLAGMTQDQVGAILTSPTSPLAQALIGSANEISAAICNTDGEAPASVCDSKGVVAADQAMKITPPAGAPSH